MKGIRIPPSIFRRLCPTTDPTGPGYSPYRLSEEPYNLIIRQPFYSISLLLARNDRFTDLNLDLLICSQWLETLIESSDSHRKAERNNLHHPSLLQSQTPKA